MDINIHLDYKQIKEAVIGLLLNIIGSSLLAFGICAFIEPFHLVVGGASGIALITHRLLGVRVSAVAFLINMSVLIPGYFLGGKKLVFGSLLSSFIFPTALAVFERMPQITMIADNIMLAAICGGVVCGAGIGLVMKSGGSTGGMDIPAILISKYLHLHVDGVMNGIDVLIMMAQLPFSVISSVLYGIIYTYIMTKTLGTVLTFAGDRLKMTVVSERYEDICLELSQADYGVTLSFAEGGYTRTPIKKIESVMPSVRYREALRLIERVDPEAFITVQTVKEVKGRGYTMKKEYISM